MKPDIDNREEGGDNSFWVEVQQIDSLIWEDSTDIYDKTAALVPNFSPTASQNGSDNMLTWQPWCGEVLHTLCDTVTHCVTL